MKDRKATYQISQALGKRLVTLVDATIEAEDVSDLSPENSKCAEQKSCIN